MSALGLFTLILLAVLLQIGIAAAVAFHRHWQAYEDLLRRTGGGGTAASPAPVAAKPPPVPAGWAGYRPLRVIAKTPEDRAGSVCSFELAPADGGPLPPFLPGQFLTFRLEVADPATGMAKPIVRCYSLSDRPRQESCRVSIKRVPAPQGAADVPPGLGSGHFHDHVQVGDILQVKAPSGHFALDPKGDGPLVLVAGGIGVTPMFSMAAACLHHNPQREIWFFYGVRDAGEEAFGEQLRSWSAGHPAFHLHLCHSRPGPDALEGRDYDHRGHVDIRLLRLTLPLKPFSFYICGPRAMMESLVPALLEWGVPANRVHYEAFGPASLPRLEEAAPPPEAPGELPGETITVTFARSQREVAWRPEAGSLLELAEANGIGVESGCRAGGCGMCQTRVEAGTVAYSHSPDHDPEPGTCLLCVARPTSNLVLSA